MSTPFLTLLPLASPDPPLALVGGKGRSLAKVAARGLPVPDGFLITTNGYKTFVAANRLQDSIHQVLGDVASGQVSSQDASAQIQQRFQSGELPDDLARAFRDAYQRLGEPAVAVRSSATAEDLPELSFAGQQDSFLNVRGAAALLQAVQDCWASLFTARAIDYRRRMGVDQHLVAMGVVVQQMAPADVAGILFTANPASGDRDELLVNASYGLGEAVVGGHVTPDSFVLKRQGFACKQRRLGDKSAMFAAEAEQGAAMQPTPAALRSAACLSGRQLDALASLSLQVESLFDGAPQDIEWAIAGGTCWLLQSRPITNLPPAPLKGDWRPPYPGAKLIRRQVVENMPEPLSPLFDELYLRVGLEQAIDWFLEEFKMPMNIDDFIDRPMFLTVNGYAYSRADYRFTKRLLWLGPRILYAYARVVPRILRTLIPDWRDKALPAYLETTETWGDLDIAAADDEQLLAGIRTLAVADAQYWFSVAIILGAAKITDGMLNRFLTSRWTPGGLTSGALLRGFSSKTIEAQEELERIAREVLAEPTVRELVRRTSAERLLEELAVAEEAAGVSDELHAYLTAYGCQVYNLDFVAPTQIEQPLPIMQSFKTLVESGRFGTAARQQELIQERDALVEQTSKALGPLRRRLFRKLLGWAQTYGPHREEALFYMGASWPALRRLALELGRRFVEADVLSADDDVFYLEFAELQQACAARVEGRGVEGRGVEGRGVEGRGVEGRGVEGRGVEGVEGRGVERRGGSQLAELAAERRQLRESRKRLHPPGMIPERSRFTLGPFDFSIFETQRRNAADSNTLRGFAVSPGRVTARASVIRSPSEFDRMEPRTVLVCPTTTPAWTLQFAHAAALVTDIGGVLAHGSIVAREYGIPAVMGTGNATQRIVHGQQITVDGDAGTVTIE